MSSFSEFCKLREGTLFVFSRQAQNSLYYIKEQQKGLVLVQEFTGNLPPQAITKEIWAQNKISIYKIYTIEDMNMLELTLATLIGLLEL